MHPTIDAFNAALRDSGELIDSQGLVERPKAVRMVGNAPVVTDGPYLEAKEYVGSYFVVDVSFAYASTSSYVGFSPMRSR